MSPFSRIRNGIFLLVLWCVCIIVAERNIFNVKPLPYSYKALEPHLSRQTLEFHYDKHYRHYIGTLNKMLRPIDRLEEATTLEEIMMDSYQWNRPLFNTAAQAWNHDFYFKCMTSNYFPPSDSLKGRISYDFGSFERFAIDFRKAGNSVFGSGWAWLIFDASTGKLFVTKTSGADNPMIPSQHYRPILVMDIWEHAYYLDFQNRRKDYTETFVNALVDWRFVEDNLAREEANVSRVMDKRKGEWVVEASEAAAEAARRKREQEEASAKLKTVEPSDNEDVRAQPEPMKETKAGREASEEPLRTQEDAGDDEKSVEAETISETENPDQDSIELKTGAELETNVDELGEVKTGAGVGSLDDGHSEIEEPTAEAPASQDADRAATTVDSEKHDEENLEVPVSTEEGALPQEVDYDDETNADAVDLSIEQSGEDVVDSEEETLLGENTSTTEGETSDLAHADDEKSTEARILVEETLVIESTAGNGPSDEESIESENADNLVDNEGKAHATNLEQEAAVAPNVSSDFETSDNEKSDVATSAEEEMESPREADVEGRLEELKSASERQVIETESELSRKEATAEIETQGRTGTDSNKEDAGIVGFIWKIVWGLIKLVFRLLKRIIFGAEQVASQKDILIQTEKNSKSGFVGTIWRLGKRLVFGKEKEVPKGAVLSESGNVSKTSTVGMIWNFSKRMVSWMLFGTKADTSEKGALDAAKLASKDSTLGMVWKFSTGLLWRLVSKKETITITEQKASVEKNFQEATTSHRSNEDIPEAQTPGNKNADLQSSATDGTHDDEQKLNAATSNAEKLATSQSTDEVTAEDQTAYDENIELQASAGSSILEEQNIEKDTKSVEGISLQELDDAEVIAQDQMASEFSIEVEERAEPDVSKNEDVNVDESRAREATTIPNTDYIEDIVDIGNDTKSAEGISSQELDDAEAVAQDQVASEESIEVEESAEPDVSKNEDSNFDESKAREATTMPNTEEIEDIVEDQAPTDEDIEMDVDEMALADEDEAASEATNTTESICEETTGETESVEEARSEVGVEDHVASSDDEMEEEKQSAEANTPVQDTTGSEASMTPMAADKEDTPDLAENSTDSEPSVETQIEDKDISEATTPLSEEYINLEATSDDARPPAQEAEGVENVAEAESPQKNVTEDNESSEGKTLTATSVTDGRVEAPDEENEEGGRDAGVETSVSAKASEESVTLEESIESDTAKEGTLAKLWRFATGASNRRTKVGVEDHDASSDNEIKEERQSAEEKTLVQGTTDSKASMVAMDADKEEIRELVENSTESEPSSEKQTEDKEISETTTPLSEESIELDANSDDAAPSAQKVAEVAKNVTELEASTDDATPPAPEAEVVENVTELEASTDDATPPAPEAEVVENVTELEASTDDATPPAPEAELVENVTELEASTDEAAPPAPEAEVVESVAEAESPERNATEGDESSEATTATSVTDGELEAPGEGKEDDEGKDAGIETSVSTETSEESESPEDGQEDEVSVDAEGSGEPESTKAGQLNDVVTVEESIDNDTAEEGTLTMLWKYSWLNRIINR